MSEATSPHAGLTRRSFLKTTGVVAGAAAVAGTAQPALAALAEDYATGQAETEGEQLYTGQCRANCNGGCFLNIHVRDGRIVKTSRREMPDTRYSRVCLRGLSHPQRANDPDRLKYPLKRTGERGAGEWERISWDEAISTIGEKWRGYIRDLGPASIAISPGSGSWGSLNGRGPGDPRLRLQKAAGFSFIDQAFDMAFCWAAPQRLGSSENQSFNEPADLLNSKCIILWGTNLLESGPQTWHFINEAHRGGCKLITIDPIWTATASKSDMYVPIRPGSDAALAIGLCSVVIDQGLLDEDFMRASTDAPFLVKEDDGAFLRLSDLGAEGSDDIVVRGADGTVDVPDNVPEPVLEGSFEIGGHRVTTVYSLVKKRVAEYPLERVEELTQVPIDTIKDIALAYAQGPSSIMHGFGMDHYVNGHYSYTSSFTLAMLTGNIGREGSSCGWCYTVGQKAINAAMPLPDAYKDVKVGPTVAITDLCETVKAKEYGGKPFDLKSIFVYSHNPLGNSSERNKMIEAYNEIEFIIVCDMFMSDTAEMADIVLPACYWFETEDIVGSNTQHPYVTFQEKAVDPSFETKRDYEIVSLLAAEIGVEDCFPPAEEYMASLLDWDGAKAKGITFEGLKRDKIVRQYNTPQIHGEGGVFPTPTKRVHMYLEKLIPRVQANQEIPEEKERILYFEPPHEAWFENELYKKYPIVCVNKHSRWRTHSQFFEVEALRELDPEPLALMNKDDAAARGIEDGDIVEVYNDRGHVVLRAQVDAGIPSGMVNIPKGWHREQFIDGHYQELTCNVTNPMVKNNAYFDTLVEIRKA